MRPAILLCLFVIFSAITNAQFTLIPQIGLENSKTFVERNESSFFSPLGAKISPQAALRLNYLFSKGHGPYLGVATSKSAVQMNFTDPEAPVSDYTSAIGAMQLRLEAGYQVSSQPIYLTKASSGRKVSKSIYSRSSQKNHCSKYIVKTGCGSKMNKPQPSKSRTVASRVSSGIDKRPWVRIQPSVGMAYLPSTPSSNIVATPQGSLVNYQYNAGNWNTAILGGLAFEFGRGAKRNFIVSMNYVKGLNESESTITTLNGNKPTVTSFESHSSSWNVRMGIPISLSKNKSDIKQVLPNQRLSKVQKKCGTSIYQYQKKCTRRS